MLCTLFKVNCHFGKTYRFYLQEQRSQACHLHSCWCLVWNIPPLRWWRYTPLKRQLTFNGLYGIISKKNSALHNQHYENHKS